MKVGAADVKLMIVEAARASDFMKPIMDALTRRFAEQYRFCGRKR
jgi:hypothetical protein